MATTTTRLLIEYDGTDFAGWALQRDERSVEGVLVEALTTLRSGAPTPLTVAGRTDRGVHAWGQVASYAGEPVSLRSLNALLPSDVAVLACEAAADGFDARRDARARTYCFRVLNRRTPGPFERRTALHVPQLLDRPALTACAALLDGRHDFTAFTPTETRHKHFTKTIRRAEWRLDGKILEFWIESDSFLRHMNRILVGTMLQVATGRRPLESFAALLEGAPREEAGPTAPPHGLHLASVRY